MLDFIKDRREAFRLAVELKTCGRKTAGRLLSCMDVMPRDLCADLDLPAGSTYAQGARKVRTTSLSW
jgi:hypothetical protein